MAISFRSNDAVQDIKETIIIKLTEETGVSPEQARTLLKKYNGDFKKALKKAASFNAGVSSST